MRVGELSEIPEKRVEQTSGETKGRASWVKGGGYLKKEGELEPPYKLWYVFNIHLYDSI